MNTRRASRTAALAVGGLLLILGPVPVEAQAPAEARGVWDDIVEEWRTRVHDEGVVGASIGFVYDGSLVDLQTHGMEDLAQGRKVDDATIYHWASITKTFTAIAIMQLRDRGLISLDDPIVDYCEEHGIGFLPWYPLAAGPLTRPEGAVGRVAAKHGATAAQISLAWLLARSPVMLPIPGTSSVAHLEENMAAADIVLDAEDMAALDTI